MTRMKRVHPTYRQTMDVDPCEPEQRREFRAAGNGFYERYAVEGLNNDS